MRYLNLHTCALVVAVGAFTFAACDSPTPRSAPSSPRAEARPAQERPPIEPMESIAVERQRFVTDARDPFTSPAAEVATQGTRAFDQVECDLETEPLGFTSPDALRLIGLVTGTAVPRAMILGGGGGKAVLANEGDRVGPRCSQRIIEIRDNEVIVAPFGADDDPRQQTIIMLREEGLDAVINETN